MFEASAFSAGVGGQHLRIHVHTSPVAWPIVHGSDIRDNIISADTVISVVRSNSYKVTNISHSVQIKHCLRSIGQGPDQSMFILFRACVPVTSPGNGIKQISITSAVLRWMALCRAGFVCRDNGRAEYQ